MMCSTPLTLDEYNFTKTWRARFHFRNLRFGGFTLEHGCLDGDPDLPLTYPPFPPSTLPHVLPLMCMRAGVLTFSPTNIPGPKGRASRPGHYCPLGPCCCGAILCAVGCTQPTCQPSSSCENQKMSAWCPVASVVSDYLPSHGL